MGLKLLMNGFNSPKFIHSIILQINGHGLIMLMVNNRLNMICEHPYLTLTIEIFD
jgi:hypothetical protein